MPDDEYLTEAEYKNVEKCLQTLADLRGGSPMDGDDFLAVIPIENGMRQILVTVVDVTEECVSGEFDAGGMEAH